MELYLDTQYFAEHLQCSREEKQKSLYIVELLLELAATARSQGLVALDRLLEEQPDRFRMPFLRKAVQLITDVGSREKVEQVLFQYILSSGWTGEKFLVAVVVAETMLALHRNDDPDYIFNFLVPSLFGLDFDICISGIYRRFRLNQKKKREHAAENLDTDSA